MHPLLLQALIGAAIGGGSAWMQRRDPLKGALLGGGLAGFGSRGKDRWWAIPSGIIGGAMVGCQLDGG